VCLGYNKGTLNRIKEIMIENVRLGSIKNNNNSPNNKFAMQQKKGNTSFTGMGDFALKAIQACEAKPMLNVTVLDLSTAIIPRTAFETIIGSKQKDENGNDIKKRKLNLVGGFEALRREGSGLVINCLIPGFIVTGAAKMLNRPIMQQFNASNLTKSWANGDSIKTIQKYYTSAAGATEEEKIYNTLKSISENLEGVNGDISEGGLKQFKEVLSNDEMFDRHLKRTANLIATGKSPKKGTGFGWYRRMVKDTGIAENIRFVGDKSFSPNSLEHLCNSTCEILSGVVKEKAKNNIKSAEDLSKYFANAAKLVNAKSILGLGMIIPLAISAQPINRWITHKISGKKGAPIYNDDKERILTPEEKKKLLAHKALALPLLWSVAGLSMLMDRPSLKMFQFKNIFPTMDQARIISASTFSSRLAASEDSSELWESTIRDIATFSSFYFLGDYAAKGIATYLEKTNKDGIKLINRLKPSKDTDNAIQRFWNWAKHTKIKSTDELGSIADKALRAKAKNLRALCQWGNIAFSLLSLGVFIPIYTRTQINRKKQLQEKNMAVTPNCTSFKGTFTQNLIKDNTKAFKTFFN
jgi:hypothetical protein